MDKHTIIEALRNRKDRSAWDKAVTAEAIDMLDYCDAEELPEGRSEIESLLLNGARDWSQYSYGGCSLVYDREIAERYCTPSELKRKRHGDLEPNGRETWLDVQARACEQAACRIWREIKKAER